MAKILLLVDIDTDRIFLQEQLSSHHKIITELQKEEFDLCIVDLPNLSEVESLLFKKREQEMPVILPVLALCDKISINLLTGYLGKCVDELLITPVLKVELRARVEMLLKTRSLSRQVNANKGKLSDLTVCLQHATDAEKEEAKVEHKLQHKQFLLTEAQHLIHLGSWEYPIELAPRIIWSDEMYRIFEINPEEIEPSVQVLINRIHPDDRESMRKWLSTTMEGNEARVLDFRIILPDGTEKFIRGTGKPFFNQSGKVAGAIGTAQDITDQKLIEKKLRRSEERFHGFFNLNKEYCYIVSPTGQIMDVNQAALYVLGYKYDELIGKPIATIYTQESRAHFKSTIDTWKQTGIIRNTELDIQTRKGDHRTVILNVTTEYNPDGSLSHFISLQHDITERKLAERAIVQERNLSNQIIESLPGIFYLFDQSGRFLRWNKLFETITGYAAEEISQIHPLDLFRSVDREFMVNRIRGVFETGQGEVEAFFVPKKGEAVPYFFTGRRMMYDGKTCLCGMGIDITERKKIENNLRESETRLRLFIEHAPAAIAMFDLDMRYLAVSRRWITDFQIMDKEIIGKSHYEIFPDVSQYLRSAHLRGLKGEVVRDEEYRFIRFDGSVQWLRWEVRPWYTVNGAVGGIVIFTEDTTWRKISEEQLATERERLAVTLRSIGDGVIATDTDDRVVLINKAGEKLTGWEQDKAYGRPLGEVFKTIGVNTQKKTEPSGLNVGQKDNLVLISKGGQKSNIAESREPIIDNKGNILGMVLVFRDITERKKYDINMQSSLHQKEVLLQELYHRTKNNMQVISALLELQAASSGNEEIERIVRDSQSRIRTMALAHEKLYKSKSLSQIGMKGYITDLAQLLMTTYGISSKRISFNFDIEDINILIDVAIPCGLIVTELISNSFKHAFPGEKEGQIDIFLHRKDTNRLKLTIGDNGVGIQPGFDIQKSTSLGIQLVNQIVRHQLHGSIRTESDGGLRWFIIFRNDIYSERV